MDTMFAFSNARGMHIISMKNFASKNHLTGAKNQTMNTSDSKMKAFLKQNTITKPSEDKKESQPNPTKVENNLSVLQPPVFAPIPQVGFPKITP